MWDIISGVTITAIIGVISLLSANLWFLIKSHFSLSPRIKEQEQRLQSMTNQIHDLNNRFEKSSVEIRQELKGEIEEVGKRFDRLDEKVEQGFNHINTQISSLMQAVLLIKRGDGE